MIWGVPAGIHLCSLSAAYARIFGSVFIISGPGENFVSSFNLDLDSGNSYYAQ